MRTAKGSLTSAHIPEEAMMVLQYDVFSLFYNMGLQLCHNGWPTAFAFGGSHSSFSKNLFLHEPIIITNWLPNFYPGLVICYSSLTMMIEICCCWLTFLPTVQWQQKSQQKAIFLHLNSRLFRCKKRLWKPGHRLDSIHVLRSDTFVQTVMLDPIIWIIKSMIEAVLMVG